MANWKKSFSNNIDVSKLRGARDQILAALPDAGQVVLDDSQRRVPDEKGDLRRSGKVVPVSETQVAVTYTDSSAVYAHERLNIKPANGKERKYLESAFNATRAQVLQVLADAGKRAFGR